MEQWQKYKQHAELLKVLAHPVRLCIINGLMHSGGCNVSHMQECLQVPQSTISQHLQKLRAAGIIEGERNGVEICYRVCSDEARQVVTALLAAGGN